MVWKTQSSSIFKVKVDKQTLSHRCQTAGKVSGGPAEAEYVETSWFPTHAGTSAASSPLFMYFRCCSPRYCHTQVRGSAEFSAPHVLLRPLLPPQFKGSLQVRA